MTHSWMAEFEQRLHRLEQLVVAPKSTLSEAVKLATNAIASIAPKTAVEVWISAETSLHRISDGIIRSEVSVELDELKNLSDCPSQWINHSLVPELLDTQTKNSHEILISRHPISESQELIVAAFFSDFHEAQTHITDATGAVTGLLAAKVTQHLLSTTKQSAIEIDELLQFAIKLQACDNISTIQQVIAQESGLIWPQCRVVTLEFDGNGHRAGAITGAGQLNHQSAQIQALEILAGVLQIHDSKHQPEPTVAETTKWTSLDDLQALVRTDDNELQLSQLVSDYKTAGVTHLGQTSIFRDQELVLTILLESSATVQTHYASEGRWNHLIQAAMTRTFQTRRNRSNWKRRPWPITIGLGCLLLAISFFIPMSFELTANGQLVAQGRRSIFAPESGTVTSVHFDNEQQVDLASPLITLVNPELEQRASELDGEIATTKAAVAAVNARRTSRGAEGSAAEGQVLKQRLKSLTAERDLIQQRIESLIIKAPFEGYVVRRDAVHDLTNRPLQRGQRIAELIPLKVDWELELHIPQTHSAYIHAAMKSQKELLPIRYIISSDPNKTHTATLQSIEKFTYSRNSELVQNATVDVRLPDASNAKSGTSVSARIFCGQRSLGFIATRKLIETLQYLKFVWWN